MSLSTLLDADARPDDMALIGASRRGLVGLLTRMAGANPLWTDDGKTLALEASDGTATTMWLLRHGAMPSHRAFIKAYRNEDWDGLEAMVRTCEQAGHPLPDQGSAESLRRVSLRGTDSLRGLRALADVGTLEQADLWGDYEIPMDLTCNL